MPVPDTAALQVTQLPLPEVIGYPAINRELLDSSMGSVNYTYQYLK